MVVNTITCPSCKDVLFSRCTHDMHWCTCGEVAIDGGFEYIKINFKGKMPKQGKIEVMASSKELYEDWNTGRDKFGLIKSLKKRK